MRWNDSRPEQGTLRTRRAFLLLPMKIEGETRWLERATWEEKVIYWYSHRRDSYNTWEPIRWIDEKEKPCHHEKPSHPNSANK